MINRLKDSNQYKFQQINVRFRWVDYCRIRHAFEPLPKESAASYFRRLALRLQLGEFK